MLKKKVAAALLLASSFSTPSFGRGDVWDFLGYTSVRGVRDHDKIQIRRRDGLFRAIQLRVSGEAIFFDHLVLHFDDGTSEELSVANRIAPEGRNYVFELAGKHHLLESVELWYYQETWEHDPRVSLYGTR